MLFGPDSKNFSPQKGQILFKLLRPELVKSNAVPLSSDAFTGTKTAQRYYRRRLLTEIYSGFGMGDPAHKTHNREVAEATDRLLTEVIPALAQKILNAGEDATLSVLDGSFISEIHKEGKNNVTRVTKRWHILLNAVVLGINVRHLGYLRRKLGENSPTSGQILVEMVRANS